MIYNISLYIFIGAIITLILDLLSFLFGTEDNFTNWERIKMIILWPIVILILILAFDEND